MISTKMCYLCPRTLRYLCPQSVHPFHLGKGLGVRFFAFKHDPDSYLLFAASAKNAVKSSIRLANCGSARIACVVRLGWYPGGYFRNITRS